MLTLKEKTNNYNDFVVASGITQVYPVIDKFKAHKTADETLESANSFHLNVLSQVPASKVKIDEVLPGDIDYVEPEETLEEDPEETLGQTALLIQTVVQAADLDGQEWYRTGNWIMANKGRFGEDAKGNREVSYGILDSGAEESNSVPLEDLNNSGVMVKLRKRDGSIKWSAWAVTRKFTQNLADIFMAVQVSGWSEVFPEGKLVTRPEVLDLKKVEGPGEQAIDTFKRSVEMAVKKLEECNKIDKVTILEYLNGLIEAHKVWSK
jgi:hypothetical protein